METFIGHAYTKTSALSNLDLIPVSRVMRSQVMTIKKADTLQQACKVMVQNNIGSVLIIAESGKAQTPAGIITERDIVRQMAEKPISFAAPAEQIMSKPVVTIHPNGSLRDALQTMQARDIRRLVVMSDNGTNMAGILTDKDIFRFIARNESVYSSVVSEQVLARDRDIADRLSTNLLDDIMNKRL